MKKRLKIIPGNPDLPMRFGCGDCDYLITSNKTAREIIGMGEEKYSAWAWGYAKRIKIHGGMKHK